MLVKGDKIKLVKPMGCFENIGEVCNVVDISDDAVISFRFGGLHMGCMSYNEYEKYFEKVINVKREWTEWKTKGISYCNIDNDMVYITVEYRDNGSKVQVRGFGLKSRSSCRKEDVFDLNKGLKIAVARFVVKMLDQETEEMAKSI